MDFGARIWADTPTNQVMKRMKLRTGAFGTIEIPPFHEGAKGGR